jgi:CobQ-like glutamine amidotransferase family enzyme
MTKSLTILHLYPHEMNLYGDHGNILTLEKRCHWRSINTKIIPYEPGQKFPLSPDIIFGGGGQDSGQNVIAPDLQRIAPNLKSLIEQGTPTLTICGLYQLFGAYFKTTSGEILKGINIFAAHTTAGPTRFIGNIVLSSTQFGPIVGYENHSGQTTLTHSPPLGQVKKGAGNNGQDGTEGAIYKNTLGTYLHGPLLPKNPKIADFLIATALSQKYGDPPTTLPPLNDTLEYRTQKSAASRPR